MSVKEERIFQTFVKLLQTKEHKFLSCMSFDCLLLATLKSCYRSVKNEKNLGNLLQKTCRNPGHCRTKGIFTICVASAKVFHLRCNQLN